MVTYQSAVVDSFRFTNLIFVLIEFLFGFSETNMISLKFLTQLNEWLQNTSMYIGWSSKLRQTLKLKYIGNRTTRIYCFTAYIEWGNHLDFTEDKEY